MSDSKEPSRRRIRKELEEAMRIRAQAIGTLECCRCTWPLKRHDTDTFHEEWCPAVHAIRTYIAMGKHDQIEFTRLAPRQGDSQ